LDPSEPSLFPAKTTGAEANTLAIVLEVLFHLPFVLI